MAKSGISILISRTEKVHFFLELIFFFYFFPKKAKRRLNISHTPLALRIGNRNFWENIF